MELTTRRAAVLTAEPLGSILQEQGLELDYVLPDYYPDVCKLVKCFVTPAILSESVSGGRLSYELRAQVRILYCSEHSHLIQCVTQNLLFSRTADLPQGDDVSVEICPEVDYVNCRAVSGRRLDVRGAVTIRIRTVSRVRQEVLSDAQGKGLELRRMVREFPQTLLQASQSIILTEDLELGSAQPALLHIVRYDASTADLSLRSVSGKRCVQGELRLHILYACERDGDGSLEPMSFSIPFSQMLDSSDFEEQDDVQVQCQVLSCELKPAAGGEVRSLKCEAELRVVCRAVRIGSETLLCDAFSTEHPCTCEHTELCIAGAPVPITENKLCECRIPCSEIDCVYDAWCEVRNVSVQTGDGSAEVSGMLLWNVLVRESDGTPRLLESEEAFSHTLSPAGLRNEDLLLVRAVCENCSYTLTSAGEVSLRGDLRIEGELTHCERLQVLSALSVDEETTHPHNFALKLYYGKAGEPVWDIAKRCHTSVDAIIEENDLTQDTLTEPGMLLIPIVTSR